MKPRVYLESSVVSYFANEMSSNLKVAAEQKITKEWWAKILPVVEGYISDFVVEEISKGRKDQVAARLSVIENFSALPITEEVSKLATVYIQKLALPKDGQADAYHLAMAAVHEMDFLLSWNCKHIANAFKYALIRKINKSLGYHQALTICTPRELMEI